jgi:hypothetical protein
VPIRLSASVEKGAAAARGREQLVTGRVEDHGLRDQLAMAQRDRHRVLRKAVDEVGRAVQRIDDPCVLGVPHRAGLLGEHRVIRVGLQQRVDDRALGGMVDLGDEVGAALGADPDGVEVDARAVDDRAGLACGLHGRIEHRMHDGARAAGAPARLD